jgi:signal transduction histidine kinase
MTDFHARIAELEAAAAAKDAFIAGLSRELANPLAPVLLAVERVRAVANSGDAARLATALGLLERAIYAFDRRTRVLLNLADITAGVASPAPVALELAELLMSAADRHGDMARRAGCPLSVEADPGLLALASEAPLAQVLDYLLANAFRFGAGRPVTLRARPGADGHVIASVIDQGPGMDEAEAARALQPFQQPRGVLEPGLGVGLWVASQLVAAMGGRLSVESAPGHGAHFHVTLATPEGAPVAPEAENLQFRDKPVER